MVKKATKEQRIAINKMWSELETKEGKRIFKGSVKRVFGIKLR
jgi:hypothetical protein|tara:strand:+ start:44 stop:172 length:129 start_codon:yes stop_codon:yes gene_type:complete